MSVRWWPVAPAPSGDEGRLAWLTGQWAVVDEWVDARAQQPAVSAGAGAPGRGSDAAEDSP
jgi:hypothetical protein